jgi:hypothetical protein
MKRKFAAFVVLFLFSLILTRADMPGNAPRSAMPVSIKGINRLSPYILMGYFSFSDTVFSIASDSTYELPGGYGAPTSIVIFARNGGVTTDSIFIFNEEKDITVEFSGIRNNKLQYLSITPVTISTDTVQSKTNRFTSADGSTVWYLRNEMFIGLSLVALVGAIVWFLYRKKKKNLTDV